MSVCSKLPRLQDRGVEPRRPAVSGFPRFYVDADVTAPARLGPANRRAPGRGGCARGSAGHEPRPAQLEPGRPRLLPHLGSPALRSRGMIGVGVYALSDDGRRRFGEFPDVIADDGYVRRLFDASERVRVDDAPVRVYAPARLSDLVRIKTRSRLGRYELGNVSPISSRASGRRSPTATRSGRSSCDPGFGRPPRSMRLSLSESRRRARLQLGRSATTSGSETSRRADPAGADVTQISSGRRRGPISAPAAGCSPRGSCLPSR